MKNIGKSQYRFKSNPLEEVFAIAWEDANSDDMGRYTTLDHLLAEDRNYPCEEVTERDRMVAATVIQWLGSPVGQVFLEEAEFKGRWISRRRTHV